MNTGPCWRSSACGGGCARDARAAGEREWPNPVRPSGSGACSRYPHAESRALEECASSMTFAIAWATKTPYPAWQSSRPPSKRASLLRAGSSYHAECAPNVLHLALLRRKSHCWLHLSVDRQMSRSTTSRPAARSRSVPASEPTTAFSRAQAGAACVASRLSSPNQSGYDHIGCAIVCLLSDPNPEYLPGETR